MPVAEGGMDVIFRNRYFCVFPKTDILCVNTTTKIWADSNPVGWAPSTASKGSPETGVGSAKSRTLTKEFRADSVECWLANIRISRQHKNIRKVIKIRIWACPYQNKQVQQREKQE